MKSRFGGAARLLWALLSLLPIASAQDALLQHYQKAQEAQAAQDYTAAIQHYERIVVLRPDLAEAFANLGALYYEIGQRDKAAAALKKALTLKPGLAGPHFFLGALASKSHNYAEALRYLDKAQTLDPDNLLVQLYLGYAYFGQSKYRDAIPRLQRASALEESRADVFYHLSKAYAQLSRDGLERLQKIHPQSQFLSLVRAHFFEAQGNVEEAKVEYDRLIRDHPQAAGLKQRRETLERRDSESITSPALIEGATIDSTVYFYDPPSISQIREKIEEHQNIAETLNKEAESPQQLYAITETYKILSYLSSLWVVQSDPDSYRSQQLKGELFEAQGKTEEAIASYLSSIERQPRLEGINFAIGNLYWVDGKMDHAIGHLRKEIALNPHHPQALYEIGDILYSEGKLPEAAKYFSDALRVAPKMTEAHLAAARIFEQQGQTAAALEHLRQVVRIEPQNPAPHYRLSVIYRKLGKPVEAEAARRTFQKLKTAQPAEN